MEFVRVKVVKKYLDSEKGTIQEAGAMLDVPKKRAETLIARGVAEEAKAAKTTLGEG